MRTLVIGCNHRSAPVEIRERLAFDEAAVPAALHSLRERFPQAEGVLLSTCNRIELYIARPATGQPRIAEAITFLAECRNAAVEEFAQALYSREDVEAMRHLFRVVSSLDSMVLGETQILGQTKAAFEIARQAGSVGPVLGPLFQKAFGVAKEIHHRTTIAAGRMSVGSTAVELARQIFSHFNDKTVLMVGAGKMGELTLRHLLETQPQHILVTNRTSERAADLAARLRSHHNVQARVVPYADWIDTLADVDIVISSTGSREPILNAGQLAPVLKKRQYRSLLLVDIAVPRDIDPGVGELDNVFLYNIDDLQAVTEATIVQRREAIEQCQRIIEKAIAEHLETQAGREVGPLIDALRRRLGEINAHELEWLLPKLQGLNEHDRALIEQLLHRVSQKILHDPIRVLNDRSANGMPQVYADTLRVMFNLKIDDVP